MIAVEHNIPIPKYAQEPITNSFIDALNILGINDSFEFQTSDLIAMHIAIACATWQSNYERKYVFFHGNSYKSRVWRTA